MASLPSRVLLSVSRWEVSAELINTALKVEPDLRYITARLNVGAILGTRSDGRRTTLAVMVGEHLSIESAVECEDRIVSLILSNEVDECFKVSLHSATRMFKEMHVGSKWKLEVEDVYNRRQRRLDKELSELLGSEQHYHNTGEDFS